MNFVGCVVAITHDRWFLDRIATHILAFEGDGYVHGCEGNFETYEQQRKERLGINDDEPRRFRLCLLRDEPVQTGRKTGKANPSPYNVRFSTFCVLAKEFLNYNEVLTIRVISKTQTKPYRLEKRSKSLRVRRRPRTKA